MFLQNGQLILKLCYWRVESCYYITWCRFLIVAFWKYPRIQDLCLDRYWISAQVQTQRADKKIWVKFKTIIACSLALFHLKNSFLLFHCVCSSSMLSDHKLHKCSCFPMLDLLGCLPRLHLLRWFNLHSSSSSACFYKKSPTFC